MHQYKYYLTDYAQETTQQRSVRARINLRVPSRESSPNFRNFSYC